VRTVFQINYYLLMYLRGYVIFRAQHFLLGLQSIEHEKLYRLPPRSDDASDNKGVFCWVMC
jgi:hypothetical protein